MIVLLLSVSFAYISDIELQHAASSLDAARTNSRGGARARSSYAHPHQSGAESTKFSAHPKSMQVTIDSGDKAHEGACLTATNVHVHLDMPVTTYATTR